MAILSARSLHCLEFISLRLLKIHTHPQAGDGCPTFIALRLLNTHTPVASRRRLPNGARQVAGGRKPLVRCTRVARPPASNPVVRLLPGAFAASALRPSRLAGPHGFSQRDASP